MTPLASTPSRRLEAAWLLLIALACGWLYSWNARQGGAWFTRDPVGVYGLQTQGFREGHLYLKLQPHPGLLALPNPYDGVANAPYRVLDLSFWRGRYYMYFSAVPILCFIWPLGALTGWFPTESCTVCFFCVAGTWVALLLLQSVRRRYFPAAPAWSLVLGAAVIALGSPVSLLTVARRFYEVPISCAFCLHLLTWGAIYRALSGRRPAGWMAAASLLFGLTVAARPDYLLDGMALPLAGLWLLRRRPAETSGAGRLGRLVLAAVGPAAACGGAVMLYNWLRFGSVWEFGVHYQLSNADPRLYRIPGLRQLWPNASDYLFNRGVGLRYFPFLALAVERPIGVLLYAPWLWLAPFALLPIGSEEGKGGGARLFGLLLLLGFVAKLFLLSFLLPSTLERYEADYVSDGLLLASLGALALGSWVARRRRGKTVVILGLLGAAGFSSAVGLLIFALRLPNQDDLRAIARFYDRPVAFLEHWRGAHSGALRLELALPTGRTGRIEPIFQTGLSPDQSDWLQIEYLPQDRAQLGFFHAGSGLVVGRPFAIPASRRISVTAHCSSLLPPYAHPDFAHWTSEDYKDEGRNLRVAVDGALVLQAAVECYPSDSDHLQIGTNGWGSGRQRFSGRVVSWQREPLGRPPAAFPALHRPAPVELRVLFPAHRSEGYEPLLLTGSGRQADLVYCIYEGQDRARLALDHSDSSGPRGEVFSYDPTRPSVVEIWLGSLTPPGSSEEGTLPPSRRIVASVDGTVTLNEEASFNRAAPETIQLGRNFGASSTVGHEFSGLILGVSQAPDLAALPPARSPGEYGAVELEVLLPPRALGAAEPLVVTGVTGAGDIVYVRYEDAKHVRICIDHWGFEIPASDLIPLDYGRPHRFEISMGSLYPPGGAGPRAQRVTVKLDGSVALDREVACYPSSTRQIQLGQNPIGGSFCGPSFSGRILSVKRNPAPRE